MVNRTKKAPAESVAEAKITRADMAAYADVASTFKAVRPAAEVIRRIEAVPTVFPDFDNAVKIGGWPLAKVGLIHGPSAEGKSPMLIGIMRSFVAAGHFANFGDFERSTPEQWARALFGPTWGHPALGAVPPEVHTYEDVRVMHRQWCEAIANAREQGRLPTGTSGCFGIDSIRKLLPKGIWEELKKASKADVADAQREATRTVNGRKKKAPDPRFAKKSKGQDGAGGRAGQIKAGYLSVWFDELVPLLTATNTSMVIITRETDNPEAEFNEDTFKIGGGTSLLYESSLWIRVTSRPTYVEEDGVKDLVGQRHSIGIRRSKVSARANKVDYACFHTSNGKETPLGFDRARDLFELGQSLGVIELAGSYYKMVGRQAQGEAKAIALCRTAVVELEAECRKVMAEEMAKAAAEDRP